MSSCDHDCQKCACRQRVPSVPAKGVAVWSRSGTLTPRLRKLFPPSDENDSVFLVSGASWRDQLATLIDSLTPPQVIDLMASTYTEDAPPDPWRAVAADAMVRRSRATWLPELLNNHGLQAHLQPIVDLRQQKVTAFEALMRAEVDGRTVSAGEIIEAAHAHGAMFQFDQQAREAAIRQGAVQLHDDEQLFINFSPTVIYDPQVCLQTTWAAAREVGCDLSRLVFEVVESEAFPDVDHLKRILNAYRDRGARVALDDLGSGHTALVFIDQLQPDLVKLDRELLPLHPTEPHLRLLSGLVDYAHGRGIKVLIEGVETQEQLRAVQSVGADLAQGWLFGYPAPRASRDVEAAFSVLSGGHRTA